MQNRTASPSNSYDSSSDYSSEEEQERQMAEPEPSTSSEAPFSTQTPTRVPPLGIGKLNLTHSQPSAPSQAPGLSGNGTGPGEEQPRPNHPGGPMDRDNRVPLLQLKREQSAMGEDSTMRHINKPPRLNLSGNSGIFNRSASSREPREAEAGVSIQLISNALSVEAATLRRGQELGIGRLEVLRQACSSKLGLAPAALKLFELREVPVGVELSADAAQIGVMVEGSVSQVDMACSKEQALPRRLQDAAAGRPYLTDFSLAAMEGIIGDLTRMTAERDRSAASVESLQQVLKNQNEQLARSNLQTGDQETELRRLQERCRQLDKEAVITRQQLQRSDQMRLEGQRALQDLKAEFDALTRDMSLQLPAQPLLEPTVSNASSMSRSFGARQTMRTASASVQHSRLAGVLEKLTDEEVLTRLEHCLNIGCRTE